MNALSRSEGVIWSPSREYVERANVTRLMRTHGFESFHELLAASQSDPRWFWDSVVKDLKLEFFEPYGEVMDDSDGKPWVRWFSGGKINVAHNCLDRWAARSPGKKAIVWEGEDGSSRTVTYEELFGHVNQLSNCLVDLGIGVGDTVGIFMPLMPEAVAVTLACEKVGAICVPLFSGFGPEAVAERLRDSGARLLVTADGYLRRGRLIRMKEIADQAAMVSPSVEHVIVCLRLGRQDLPWVDHRDMAWEEALSSRPRTFATLPLDAEHPFLLAYTSGTTGKPKGCVHAHGGFLVKVCAEAAYQVDIHEEDVATWITDLGWVMGPWVIIAAGAFGATLFLYDGAPDYPQSDRLWRMVERHRIGTLGMSPSLVRALLAAGQDVPSSFDLSSLRVLGSTGEPCDPQSYMWYFQEVGGGRCPIINMSGGTEAGSILSTHPVTQLKPATLGGPALGMNAEVWIAEGQRASPGEVGELVCKSPWPGMTRGIWGDRERYLDAYWRRWPDVWVHGDWASVDDEGFWFLHGRSDDVINTGGKRIGPAEIENALTSHPAVVESAAVGVPDQIKGETIWCFVILDESVDSVGDPFRKELADLVATRLGKAFRPVRVVPVQRLPKTRTGKTVRRVLRACVLTEDPGDLSALENPMVLESIRAALLEG